MTELDVVRLLNALTLFMRTLLRLMRELKHQTKRKPPA
jgi:hypothetical protein